VILGWVMFRADNVGEAMRFYEAMFSFDGRGVSEIYGAGIDSLQLSTLGLAYLVLLIAGIQNRRREDAALGPVLAGGGPATALTSREVLVAALVLPIFALAVLKLSAQSYSPFLYFQF
jgi:alginate O-acetyltransferase complex protein AlgI